MADFGPCPSGMEKDPAFGICRPIAPSPIPSRSAIAALAAPPGTTTVPPSVVGTPSEQAVIARMKKEDEQRQLAAKAAEAAAKEATTGSTIPGPKYTGPDPNAVAEVERTNRESAARLSPEKQPEAKKAYDTLIGPHGQILVVQPDRAGEYLNRGWRYRQSSEDTFKDIRAQAADSPYRSAAAEPGSASSAFIAPGKQPEVPFSQQLENLQGYTGNAPARGSWTFRGGYAETGKVGPREGYGTLSRLEQISARRGWLDRRVAEEQAREAAAARQAAEVATAGQAVKAAELDPYEMARIRAQGQYGGEAIKARADFAARQQAYAQMLTIYQQALQTQDPQEKRQLMEMAAAIGNILTGQRVTQSPQDFMSMLIGQGLLGGGLGGAVAATGTPPKT